MPGRLSNPLVQPTPLSPIHMLKHPHLYMPEGNVVIQVNVIEIIVCGKSLTVGIGPEYPFQT